MWIMTDVGYLSIVEHQDDTGLLLVRARVEEDITNVFGAVEVEVKPGADYLYRAVLDRDYVANVIWEKVMTLDYTSHAKDVAIQRSHPVAGRSSAYYATWTAMARIQPYAPYAKVPRSEQRAADSRTARGTYAWQDRQDDWDDYETDKPMYTAADLAKAVAEAGIKIEERRSDKQPHETIDQIPSYTREAL